MSEMQINQFCGNELIANSLFKCLNILHSSLVDRKEINKCFLFIIKFYVFQFQRHSSKLIIENFETSQNTREFL